MSYISREKAKEEILNLAVSLINPKVLVVEDTMCVLDGIPAADVISITRCRDCKHYAENPIGKLKTCFVHILRPQPMPEDGFCCYGERRGE